MLVLKSPLQRGYSLKPLSNTNVPLNSGGDRNIWMCKKAGQSGMFSEMTSSEKLATCSFCSLVLGGLEMRDHCIQNQPHSACKTYLVGVFWVGRKGGKKKQERTNNTKPNPKSTKKQTKQQNPLKIFPINNFTPQSRPPPPKHHTIIWCNICQFLKLSKCWPNVYGPVDQES